MGVMSVLVAEDDRALSMLYELWLDEAGYEVLVAGDGVEALELVAREGLPDAAVLDVEMPRVDGLELCRRLRLLARELPIVIVTAREDVRDAALAAGADLVVAKPADRTVLHAALESLPASHAA